MYYPEDEPERTSLYRYFLTHDFEVAMKGLLNLIGYQDKVITQLEEENNISVAQIKKYEKIIEESHQALFSFKKSYIKKQTNMAGGGHWMK